MSTRTRKNLLFPSLEISLEKPKAAWLWTALLFYPLLTKCVFIKPLKETAGPLVLPHSARLSHTHVRAHHRPFHQRVIFFFLVETVQRRLFIITPSDPPQVHSQKSYYVIIWLDCCRGQCQGTHLCAPEVAPTTDGSDRVRGWSAAAGGRAQCRRTKALRLSAEEVKRSWIFLARFYFRPLLSLPTWGCFAPAVEAMSWLHSDSGVIRLAAILNVLLGHQDLINSRPHREGNQQVSVWIQLHNNRTDQLKAGLCFSVGQPTTTNVFNICWPISTSSVSTNSRFTAPPWRMKTSPLTGFLCRCVFVPHKVSRHERRISQIEQLNLMPLYPTEKIIWDENIVPTEYYSGEGACLSRCTFTRVHSRVWALHSERRCRERVHAERRSQLPEKLHFPLIQVFFMLYRCQMTIDDGSLGLLACAAPTCTGWSSQAAWLCPSWTSSFWPSTTTCWGTSTSFAWSPPMRSDRT